MSNIVPINEQTENDDYDLSMSDDFLTDDDHLTLKQRLFIEHYLGDAKGIAYKAAEFAGYAGDRKTLAPLASRLLQHPTIAACVRARVREVMSEQEVITQLAGIARRDCSDIAMNARVKAIELLMRFHGMLVDKVEHSGTIQSQVKQVVVNLTHTDTHIDP